MADDDEQPSTSRMTSNENRNSYSNDNFSIDVRKIGFKKNTRFNFSDVLYHVQFNSKPGKSHVLLKDALEGLLHSLAKVLVDLKSRIKGGLDRNLYFVSSIT